ncbi:MAG: alpha/beta hydrolase family esterase [Ktedonobacteraceae bacterium]
MIHPVRRLRRDMRLVRQQHSPLIIASIFLLTSLLFWVLASYTDPAPTTNHVASAKAMDTVITLPVQSTGCGKSSPLTPGSSSEQTIFSGSITRSYLLHIPKGYHDTTGDALVLNFHGHGSSAAQQAYLTGFSAISDAYNIIVAYPQGVVGPDHHTGWDTGPARNPSTNDVLYVSDLLRHLQSTWCINPRHIYAIGFSNGGGMTNVLACKLAGRIAAFGSVSGAYPAVPGGCHPVRPVPFIELHGTGDGVVPYWGSLAKGYPPVTFWLQQWAQRDGCASQPVIFFDRGNVIGEKWTGCRGNVSIVHYTIRGMGHMWPRHLIIHFRGQLTTLNASTLIWTFMRNYSLPSTSALSS